MFVHSPTGTFSLEARSRVARALTDLGIKCEKLSQTDAIRLGVWVFFNEHDKGNVFQGGEAASEQQIALITYAIEGGFDDHAREEFISGATSILADNAAQNQVRTPVYVVIQETPEKDWGMHGKHVSLARMRNNVS